MAAPARAAGSRRAAPPIARTGQGCAIASVGVSLPTTIVLNEVIAGRLGVADDWIERRTGIRARRFAQPDERLAAHATLAADAGLTRAGVAARDVDLVLVAT